MSRFRSAIRWRQGSSESEAESASALALPAPSFSQAEPDTPQALFAPQHYEPRYAYPLLVWLHDSGEDEWQLLEVMPLVSLRNYVAVGPRGVLVRDATGADQWGWSQARPQVDLAEERVFAAIDAASRRYHVDRRRIFLAGAGSGGTMALRIAAAWPERFAGAASLGGPLPEAHWAPLSQWNRVRNLPVFLAVGGHSRTYSPTRACEDLRLLRTAGLVSITLREYRPCTHPVIPHALRDLDRWIMEHIDSSVRGAAACRPHRPTLPE